MGVFGNRAAIVNEETTHFVGMIPLHETACVLLNEVAIGIVGEVVGGATNFYLIEQVAGGSVVGWGCSASRRVEYARKAAVARMLQLEDVAHFIITVVLDIGRGDAVIIATVTVIPDRGDSGGVLSACCLQESVKGIVLESPVQFIYSAHSTIGGAFGSVDDVAV